MTAPVITPAVRAQARRLRAAMLRYRVMAWTTGTCLALLVFVAVPLRYAAGHPGLEQVTGAIHGVLFLVYLVSCLDVGLRARFRLARIVVMFAGGLLPGLSFVMERRVSRELGLTR